MGADYVRAGTLFLGARGLVEKEPVFPTNRLVTFLLWGGGGTVWDCSCRRDGIRREEPSLRGGPEG